MKVDAIRPDRLMAGQREAMARDIAMLASWRDGFVDVDCPACDSDGRIDLYEKYGLQHHRCTNCGTQYISPRPTDEMLGRFYAQSENYAYWAAHIYPASAETRRVQVFRPRLELVRRVLADRGRKGGTLVEVGAGYGILLEEAAATELFDRCVGLEPSPRLAEICRNRGIEVIEQPYETTALDQPADIIVAFEVIEHLFRPADFTAWLFRSVRPGGLILLTCPNICGFDTLLLGRHSTAVDHQHLNYFTPASIARLLERFGFVDVTVTTPGRLDVDLVRRAWREGVVDEAALGPFVAHLLDASDDALDQRLQQFLQQAGLSSHMMAVARRPDASGEKAAP